MRGSRDFKTRKGKFTHGVYLRNKSAVIFHEGIKLDSLSSRNQVVVFDSKTDTIPESATETLRAVFKGFTNKGSLIVEHRPGSVSLVDVNQIVLFDWCGTPPRLRSPLRRPYRGRRRYPRRPRHLTPETLQELLDWLISLKVRIPSQRIAMPLRQSYGNSAKIATPLRQKEASFTKIHKDIQGRKKEMIAKIWT